VRLLFVTQTVDADHPALAQTVDVLGALAARCETVTVLCDSVGRHDLPGNVHFRTFGAANRARRGFRFLHALAGLLLRSSARPRAILVHMVPLYLVLAAPLAKPLRVRLALWYTHWHAGRLLKLATALADVVLSVDRRSFPLDSPKLRGIGHAIDIERFVPSSERAGSGPLQLLALGRTARWKGYDTMLDALERALARGLDAELEIRGPQLSEDERTHRHELEARVAASPALSDRVRIEPPLPRAELPALLARTDALVSATQPRGSETLDKVVYEAAACGVPVIASNAALAEFLGDLSLELRFPPRDPDRLADTLLAVAAAGPEGRAEVGAELRRRVVAGHSVGAWADAVAAAITGGEPE
jgi:glycosyltransferase involved in cell wall biosynthesis